MAILKPGNKESIFFKIAAQVEREDLSEIVGKGRKGKFQVNNHRIYSPIIGEKSNLTYMESMGVVIVSSPEAEIISGAGGFDSKNNFVLPRYHFGPLAQLDMEVAMYQLANTPIMKKLIKKSDENNSGIIYFAREGHLTNWQRALYLIDNKKNIPSTIVAMSHKPSSNSYTRESQLSVKANLEGFNTKHLEILYISDPVASGMQHVKMLEELANIGCHPKMVVTIAPMATAFGMRVISLACKQLGIKFVGGCCSALLESTKPLRYYSPYPAANENQVVDIKLHKFIRKYFGDKLNKACIRCNWTGTFLGGPKMPLMASQEELKSVGTSNKELLDICKKITTKEATKSGIYVRLVPYSTKLVKHNKSN